jgi:hypothetical protein
MPSDTSKRTGAIIIQICEYISLYLIPYSNKFATALLIVICL